MGPTTRSSLSSEEAGGNDGAGGFVVVMEAGSGEAGMVLGVGAGQHSAVG